MKTIKSFNYILKSGVILSLFCLLNACDAVNPISRTAVATVNGEKIYEKELNLRLSLQKGILSPRSFAHSLNKRDALEEEILDALITEKIMLQRARELNISVTNAELDAQIADIRKDYGEEFFKLLADQDLRYEDWREHIRTEMFVAKLVKADVNAHIEIPDQDIQDYYDENPKFCKVEGRVHAAQIFVRDEEKANEVRARLNKGEDFAKLAQEVSIGPEKVYGGDLGWITRQTMPDPLDQTLFSLPAGRVSPVLKSAYGYHILKILEVQRAKVKDFSACREDILALLKSREEENAFKRWLERLKAKAVIKKEPRTRKEITSN